MHTEDHDVSFKLHKAVIHSVNDDGSVWAKIPAVLGRRAIKFDVNPTVHSSASPGLAGMVAIDHHQSEVFWIANL